VLKTRSECRTGLGVHQPSQPIPPHDTTSGHSAIHAAEAPLDALTDHFTQGFCWQLAAHLSTVTALSMWSIQGQHMAAGDGAWFIGITGWHSADQILAAWPGMEIEPIRLVDNPAELDDRAWNSSGWAQDELEESTMLRLAERILVEHGPSPLGPTT